MKTVVRAFIISILAAGLSLNAFAENDEWSHKEWSVDTPLDERIRYMTHGTVVWGHQFGFLKSIGDCKNDLLWISLSSSFDKVKDFQGKDIIFKLDIDGTTLEIETQLNSAHKKPPLSYSIMYFQKYDLGNDFIDLLKKGHELKLTVVKPEQFAKYLDVNSEVFSLNGFIASRLKAEEHCEELTGKRVKARSLAISAMRYQQQGDLDLAIGEYKKAIDLYPEYEEAICNLGLTYAEQRKFKEAVKYYLKAIKLVPNDFRSYFNLGIAYHNLGMKEKSLKYVKILQDLGFEKEGKELKRIISSDDVATGDPIFN